MPASTENRREHNETAAPKWVKTVAPAAEKGIDSRAASVYCKETREMDDVVNQGLIVSRALETGRS